MKIMINKFTEKKVTVKSAFDLGATIAIPENTNKKVPAIVLIAGTGTVDRDGNAPRFPLRVYKELSDFFAGEGFVTIRYDKRGVGESKGVHIKTGFNDLVDDVIANVKYLEGLDFVDKDKIILCGHSEGSMLATIANTRHRVGGMILIAGAGTTLRTALNYQNWIALQESKTMPGLKGWVLRKAINDKNYLKNVNKMFDKCCSTEKDVVRIAGQKMSARWIREHASLTDAEMVEHIVNADCPVLAITGEKDAQANPEDVARIADMRLPHVTCSIVPDMDHMLRNYKWEKSILNFKKRLAIEIPEPLHEGLLKDIREWTIKIGVNLD